MEAQARPAKSSSADPCLRAREAELHHLREAQMVQLRYFGGLSVAGRWQVRFGPPLAMGSMNRHPTNQAWDARTSESPNDGCRPGTGFLPLESSGTSNCYASLKTGLQAPTEDPKADHGISVRR